jgi:hypothetical protein
VPLANPVCAAWPAFRPTKIKVWTCGEVQVAFQSYVNPRYYPNYVEGYSESTIQQLYDGTPQPSPAVAANAVAARRERIGNCSTEQFNQVLFMCPLLHTGTHGMTPCGTDHWSIEHDICPYIEGFGVPGGTLESRIIVDEACKDSSSQNPQIARFIFARPVRTRYLAIQFVEAAHFVPPKRNDVYGEGYKPIEGAKQRIHGGKYVEIRTTSFF